MTSKIPTYKVILVGDGGVGKTCFVKRHRANEFEYRYIATMGVEVHPLKFHTNKGPVIFNIWDCAGQKKFGGLCDGYYIQGKAALLMFDFSSKLTYNNISTWYRDVKRVCEDIPMVVIGNKSDLKDPKVQNPSVSDGKKPLQLYCVSAKTNDNYEKPFLYLAKRFLGQDTQFVNPPE